MSAESDIIKNESRVAQLSWVEILKDWIKTFLFTSGDACATLKQIGESIEEEQKIVSADKLFIEIFEAR